MRTSGDWVMARRHSGPPVRELMISMFVKLRGSTSFYRVLAIATSAWIMVWLLCQPLKAQQQPAPTPTPDTQSSSSRKPPNPDPGWHLALSPYLWLAGTHG